MGKYISDSPFQMTRSPFKFAGLIAAGASIVGGMIGGFTAKKEQKRAEDELKKKNREMKRLRDVYSSLDTSNPYLNLENKFEDLTINQKQYDLERQQFQQSQANILDNMKGAAGGGGAAAVAQALAQQGQLASQQSAARIGDQERENLLKERVAADAIQAKEREGEIKSRDWERDKQATLLGMAQSEVAAAKERRALAFKAKMDAVTGTVSSLGGIDPSTYGIG